MRRWENDLLFDTCGIVIRVSGAKTAADYDMRTSSWRKVQPYTRQRDDVVRTIVTLWTRSCAMRLTMVVSASMTGASCCVRRTPAITALVLAGQDPPAEAVAGAIKASQDDSSGLMLAVYKSGSGRFILNTLLIRENPATHPVAERLLRNQLNYAGDGKKTVLVWRRLLPSRASRQPNR